MYLRDIRQLLMTAMHWPVLSSHLLPSLGIKIALKGYLPSKASAVRFSSGPIFMVLV
jgi:hypothetical protein